MPVVIAWLLAGLETEIGSLIVSALLWLGISIVSYKFTVGPLEGLISGYIGGSGALYANILGFLGVGQGITMILSAYATRWAVSGALSFVRKK